ncbi:MAG: response regulator [Elusimicrobiota bacterium]
MTPKKKPVVLVIAEDDDDDYLLAKTAFERASVTNELHWVKDGSELMDFLLKRGPYAGRRDDGSPMIILLDLNMPGMDGREALKEIKADASLRRIPIVVMTTSKAEDDVLKAYDLGVCSYIKKPVDFGELVEAARVLKRYWLELVELCSPGEA